MEQIIEQIIRKIDKGTYFDSYFVIDTLIRFHSDDYLRFAANNLATGKVTEYAHSTLAKIIKSYDGILVEHVSEVSLSYNIRANSSKCALWKRI